MKIFFDGRWTRTDTVDGITRYGASLVEALHELHSVTILICDERQLAHLPKSVPHLLINNPVSLKELGFAWRMNKLGADVVVSPMHFIGGGPRRYKLLLTLHDLIYYHHGKAPTFLPLPSRVIWRLFHMAYWPGRLLLERADYVLTVSETSRKLIRKYLHPKRPIAVIPNAPAKAAVAQEAGKIKKDLVYMGSFMPYKNVETLIAAMAFLPGYTLHLLSKISPEREAELQALIPEDVQVEFWHGVSDHDYAKLLATSTALMTASKDEGFGLPLIEAMAVGVPVICTDMAIFREIGGDAVHYAPADSPKTFADQVRQLEDPGHRKLIVGLGYKQAATYTWKNSAEKLLEVIRSINR